MQYLREILDGKRTESLTVEETRLIVQESNALKTYTEKAKYNLFIIEALKLGKINSDELFKNVVFEIRNINDITPAIIALKNGANPNVYIRTKRHGIMHVLAYLIVLLRSKQVNHNLIAYIVLILKLMGSQLQSKVFDVPDSSNRDELRTSNEPLTVSQWMLNNNFDPQNLHKTNIPPEIKSFISYMTDNSHIEPYMVQGGESGEKIRLDIVAAVRATNILTHIRSENPISYMSGSHINLKRCIELHYLDGFKYYITHGEYATYFTINDLILRFRDAVRSENKTLIELYSNMIKKSIKFGAKLDLYQLGLISTTSEDLGADILQLYRQPLWKKISSPQYDVVKIPNTLRNIAFNLNITPLTPKNIRFTLQELSQADPQALKDAAILRQRTRVGVCTSSISDYVEGSASLAVCQNKTTLHQDPFKYNDVSMSFYRDSDGKIWCFTSEMYQSLISNQTNPYKQDEPLPFLFIEQLKMNLNILQKYKISISKPVSFEEALDLLSIPDEITNDESEFIMGKFDVERIKLLNVEQMRSILQEFKIDQPYLSQLNSHHRVVTFCRAIYVVTKSNPDKRRRFIDMFE
jgi:hypothetical protein